MFCLKAFDGESTKIKIYSIFFSTLALSLRWFLGRVCVRLHKKSREKR